MAWLTSSTEIPVSANATTSILFSKTGQDIVRLKETEQVYEIRALTEGAALALVGVTDTTTTTTYYATFGEDEYSITVTTGTKTELTAARANEARGWLVTKRVVTYAPDGLDTKVWTTSHSGTGSSGRIVSISLSSSPVQTFINTTLFSTKKTTVREYTGLTKTEAESILNGCTTATALTAQTMKCLTKTKTNNEWVDTSWCYAQVNKGTQEYASARNVSTDEGYTVSKTTEEYSWSQVGVVNNSTVQRSWSEV